jgi:NitT/TauT family transport system substrate-binding protein
VDHRRRAGGRTVAAAAALLSLALGAPGGPALAEGTIRIAEQFGIGFLPLHVIRDQRLIEKHAAALGIEASPTWVKLSGGGSMNDALLAGGIDVGSGGVAPLLTLWDRTRGSASEVKGVAALVSMPYHLLSNRPEVRTIADLGPRDRIALPATGISIQSRTLQMASAGIWGEGQFARLDALQVALPHPEATTALLSGSTEVTAHFSSPPFQYQAVASGKAHKVLSSYEVLGGPATAIMLWATGRYRSENPKTYAAFLAALQEAVAFIDRDKAAAVDTYVRVEKSKLDPALLRRILDDPEITFTLTPLQTQKYATFMHEIGSIKAKPAGWQDYFFPEAHASAGS